jgi:hypothetical protein
LRSLSLCNILSDGKMRLSLMNMLGLSSSVRIGHIACNWKFFLLHYIQFLCQSGFAKQIIPILSILCYNGSLVTWTVVSLTTAKFKPLTFSMCGFALSYSANTFFSWFCMTSAFCVHNFII